MKVVSVKFFSYGEYQGKTYKYKSFIKDINVDDLVVVHTPSKEYSVVKVVAVEDGDDAKATKYVVDKVDIDGYEKRVAREKELADIRAKLDKKVDEVQKMFIYDKIANDNPEFAELLAEYKQRLLEDTL